MGKDSWCYLAHERLAIIDPASGDQPLYNGNKDIVVAVSICDDPSRPLCELKAACELLDIVCCCCCCCTLGGVDFYVLTNQFVLLLGRLTVRFTTMRR